MPWRARISRFWPYPFPGVAALLGEIADQFQTDALVIDVTVPVTFAEEKWP